VGPCPYYPPPLRSMIRRGGDIKGIGPFLIMDLRGGDRGKGANAFRAGFSP